MSSLHNYYPFDYPSQRTRPERAEEIGVYASNWINDVLPYRNNGVYRVHEAMYAGGGNCYAQALGTMALLSSWGVANGLVLDKYHAKAVMMHNDEVWFVDPANEVANVYGEARTIRRDDTGTLQRHYEDSLEDILYGGETQYYFQPTVQNPSENWSMQPEPAVGNDTSTHMNPHIVSRHSAGEDILCSIGDLTRYKLRDSELYTERYADLSPYVPALFHFATPVSHSIEPAHV